ncbi:cupredoxin domain-containing protein [Paenibacillus glycanilyticus]|uniref:EfeO-type cupredoxin-like domain-containing protein n=1 Tax=Paenibacillus glycanilyticus TaxID=126569 RepID=A0ABQ6GI29_9BACL|nr:cupredoxin domain-containing protein [Paenibacillus glycanilyticus]GLX70599.1 hypothetical protein MU1_49450 [Paenibacillus glycanilyticus]
MQSILKSKSVWFITIIVLICVAFFAFFSSPGGAKSQDETPVVMQQDGYQVVTIQVKKDGFYPDHVEVKAGIPVKLNFSKNTSITCIRSVLSDDLGLDQYLKKGDNYISLDNLKAGTYSFNCDMLMYHGTITVI